MTQWTGLSRGEAGRRPLSHMKNKTVYRKWLEATCQRLLLDTAGWERQRRSKCGNEWESVMRKKPTTEGRAGLVAVVVLLCAVAMCVGMGLRSVGASKAEGGKELSREAPGAPAKGAPSRSYTETAGRHGFPTCGVKLVEHGL